MPRPRLPAQPPPKPPAQRPGAAGGARDQNRRARVAALCDAGRALFLERGIDGATIDDLTQRAGIAKGSYYRYFADKTALVAALLAPLTAALLEALQEAADGLAESLNGAGDGEGTRRVFLRLSRSLFVALVRDPQVTRLLLQDSHAAPSPARAPVHALSAEVARAAERITELSLAHGLARRAAPQVSALLVIGAVERLLLAYFAGELKTPPSEAIAGVVALVLDGMRAR
jgi:AcrR family transcriptional regulator